MLPIRPDGDCETMKVIELDLFTYYQVLVAVGRRKKIKEILAIAPRALHGVLCTVHCQPHTAGIVEGLEENSLAKGGMMFF